MCQTNIPTRCSLLDQRWASVHKERGDDAAAGDDDDQDRDGGDDDYDDKPFEYICSQRRDRLCGCLAKNDGKQELSKVLVHLWLIWCTFEREQ